MKWQILPILIMLIAGCTHNVAPARQELLGYTPTGSRLEEYDLSIGIKFVNQVHNKTTRLIKGDLAAELSVWFVKYLKDNKIFTEVVNLNASGRKDVDIELEGVIKSLNVHDPGISGTSSALALFYGIAPMVEHYMVTKDVESTATVAFQLTNSKTDELLWATSLTESALKNVTLSDLGRAAFASLTKTVSTLLSDRSLHTHLSRADSSYPVAKLPKETVYTKDRSAVTVPGSGIMRRWAVIVGISKYQYAGQSGLTNLIFADDDAKAFEHSLRNLGWSDSHIKTLINQDATEKNIRIALESWLTKAGPDDQVVLFWAGHGSPDPEDPEKVYLATYDTDISIPATGYRMDKLRSALEEVRSKNVILLVDTCHAGKLITRGDSSRGISIVPNIKKMAREQKIPKGWIFMVGADTDRQSIEHSSWSNGAFTHSLLKGLNGAADGFQSAGAKDGVVTMGELKAYMKTSMPDETQRVLGVAKHPVITTSTGDPDIWNLTLQVR